MFSAITGVDFPTVDRELEIVRLKAPGAADRLYIQVVEFVQRMRTLDLFKAPGVAETIDWTNALVALNAIRLDPATVHDTLGVLLKYQDDIVKLQSGDMGKLLDELKARAGRLERASGAPSSAGLVAARAARIVI